MEKHIWETGIL